MSDVTSFQPSWYLRNGHVQTILASSPFRAWGKNPMCDAAREMIIKTPEGVRLQGYYSCQKSKMAGGLVILLHGWEGSVDSTYITCTGKSCISSLPDRRPETMRESFFMTSQIQGWMISLELRPMNCARM